MVDPTVLASDRTYLRNLAARGIPVPFAVIFGSHATGTADSWSDIDLVVVSPRFDRPIAREEINLLWRTAARTDSRIEPVPCGQRQWFEDTSSAILEIARREGACVTIEGDASSLAAIPSSKEPTDAS